MLNDARVASAGFIKYNASTTRINKEKNFKIKFQVILLFYRTTSNLSENFIFADIREFGNSRILTPRESQEIQMESSKQSRSHNRLPESACQLNAVKMSFLLLKHLKLNKRHFICATEYC